MTNPCFSINIKQSISNQRNTTERNKLRKEISNALVITIMDLDGIISTKQTVNYESKRRAVDSNTPVSFSIRVREVELRFVRDGSVLRENLLKHRTIASPVIGLEIPPCFAEVMLLRPCLRQSYPPGFNRSSFLKSAKTPLRRRAKEVVSWLKLKLEQSNKHISIIVLM